MKRNYITHSVQKVKTMKKFILGLMVTLSVSMFLVACGEQKAEEATTTEAPAAVTDSTATPATDSTATPAATPAQ